MLKFCLINHFANRSVSKQTNSSFPLFSFQGCVAKEVENIGDLIMFLPDNKNSHDIFFFASDENIVPAPKDLNTLSPERRSTFMNVWTFEYLFS